jgi:D-tyrosyl-tRNA(Tyr) deacylase
MRAVVQRVTGAALGLVGESGEVTEHARIGAGLVVLLGIEKDDAAADREWMVSKLAGLRIFEDGQGKMNMSVLEVGAGAVLLVPNFTVAGDARKGRRPSFDGAMRPVEAEAEFGAVARALGKEGARVKTGVFGAHMRVSIENDGPVTIVLDSRR